MDVISVHNRRRKYDFVFVCESKVRELENCCLIGYELERRGYSVGIINWWMPLICMDYEPVEAKVLMSHAVYKDGSLNRELSYIKGSTHVINMQWEQIYSRRELTSVLSPWKMEGEVKRAIHLSWGRINYDKLTKDDGVPKENVKVVGSVTMDFLRPEFRKYYSSREDVCREYKIPYDKTICLFISSFSLVNLPENIQEPEFKDIWDLHIRSQKMVLEWIDKLLVGRDDITFIYRPHPSEADNVLITEMERKYSNFRSIRELSVKQWIVISDIIYNWFSTSIAEVYFAGKSCHILRPITLSDDIEVTILEGGKFITSYEEFAKTLNDDNPEFPIPIKNIKDWYVNDEDKAVYLSIADVCEEVINSSDELFTAKDMYSGSKKLIYRFKSTFIGGSLLRLKHFLEDLRHKTEEDKKNEEYEQYVKEMYEKNDFTQEEVEGILSNIRRCLESQLLT